MRICVDISPIIHRHAGIGRYTYELLSALLQLDHANEYKALYHSLRPSERIPAPLDRLPSQVIRLSAKPWRLTTLIAELAGVTLDRWLPACELFHGTDYVLPPIPRARPVLTIYDLTFRLFPGQHQPLNRWYLTFMLPRLAQRADAVIVISECTRRDVSAWLKLSADKMIVIPLGVNRAFRPIEDRTALENVRAKYHLPSRFILYLGTLEPRKNLVRLLDAYAALLQHDASAPGLVIAGRKGWQYQPILQRIRELGLGSRVQWIDWVEEPDVPAMMNAAHVFVYPALYEGFGLPPLEAMACGTPVICSNTSSLPEVVGDAGILVNPNDTQALMQSLRRVITNPSLRADLRERGLAQANKFSWERTARETLAVYHHVVRGSYANRD